MNRTRQSRFAYTLIELLIVIGILGLSSALLVPRMVGREAMAAQSAVRLVISDLNFAQSDALAHQELRRIHFYSDGSGYCLTRITDTELGTPFDESDTDQDYIFDPLAKANEAGRYIVKFEQDQFQGVTIESVAIDGPTGRDIQYDSLGGTIAASGSPGSGGTIVVRRTALLGIVESDKAGFRATSEPYAALLAARVRERHETVWGLGETGAAGPTGNRYGDAAGHTCLAVSGPAARTFTLETGSDDRRANMVAFAKRGLELLAEAVVEAR
jgi:type II secretory pathway pseudopilin PulG